MRNCPNATSPRGLSSGHIGAGSLSLWSSRCFGFGLLFQLSLVPILGVAERRACPFGAATCQHHASRGPETRGILPASYRNANRPPHRSAAVNFDLIQKCGPHRLTFSPLAGAAKTNPSQIDGRVLRTGAANFSASGLKRQANDLIVIDSIEAAAANFDARFATGQLLSQP